MRESTDVRRVGVVECGLMGAVKKDDQSIEEIFKLDAESCDFKIFVTLFIKLIAESSKDSEISLESLAWSCNGKMSDFKVFVKLVDVSSRDSEICLALFAWFCNPKISDFKIFVAIVAVSSKDSEVSPESFASSCNPKISEYIKATLAALCPCNLI